MPRDFADMLLATDLPDHNRGGLAALAADPEFASDPRDEWRFHAALAGTQWRWRWYDEWAERSAALGAEPRMWQHRSRCAGRAERELGGYDHRIFLLYHSAVMLHYRNARLERPSPNGAPHWCRFDPVGDEPDVVERIIADAIADYAAGDGPAPLPPFFPGDRTGFQCFPEMWTQIKRSRPDTQPLYRLRPQS